MYYNNNRKREREVMNMDKGWIWFDMDGTIADLYGVNGWLDALVSMDSRPYKEAKTLYNEIDLLYLLSDLKAKGYHLGIISWGSKAKNANFDKRVEKVKKEWLYNFLSWLYNKFHGDRRW